MRKWTSVDDPGSEGEAENGIEDLIDDQDDNYMLEEDLEYEDGEGEEADPDDEDGEDWEDEEDEEDEGPPDWEYYADHPYAMEVVNGYILSLEPWVQKKALSNTLAKFGVTADRLAAYLRSRSDAWDDEDEDEEDGDEIEPHGADVPNDDFADLKGLEGFDTEALYELYGFDEEEGAFDPGGMGFMDSQNGFEMNSILGYLGFVLDEDMYYGPHGHDSSGVYFIPPEE